MVLRVGFTDVVGLTGSWSDMEEVKLLSREIRIGVVVGDAEYNCRYCPQFPGILFGLIGMAPGLRLSTLLGHPHQHLLPTSPVPAAVATGIVRGVLPCISLSSSFRRCSAALNSFWPCTSYSRISASKMSAATESTTVAATSGVVSSSPSINASVDARKRGERLQPAK